MVKTSPNHVQPDLNTRPISEGDTEPIRLPSSTKRPSGVAPLATPADPEPLQQGPLRQAPAREGHDPRAREDHDTREREDHDTREADSRSHARPGQGSTHDPGAVRRLDAITGDWTIFAPDRSQRPQDFCESTSIDSKVTDCPFCAGNETETPSPVWIGRELDLEHLDDEDYRVLSEDEPWSVRVVPNKYPAVASAEYLSRPDAVGESADAYQLADDHRHHPQGLFQSEPNRGGHEVIIESPCHIQSFTELDRADAALVFVAYRDRIRFWRKQPGIRYVSVFKNDGPQAGASLSHCHSQLVATSYLPSHIAAVARNMRQHQAKTGCCLQCDVIRSELKAKSRVIARTDSLIAYCPFASRMPMLVRITTVEHADRYEELPLDVIAELSQLTSRVTSWLNQLHPGVSHNYILHTRPPGVDGRADAHHWALEIFPRLTQIAGFECGSQSMINPILPEPAAARYRSRAASEDPRFVL